MCNDVHIHVHIQDPLTSLCAHIKANGWVPHASLLACVGYFRLARFLPCPLVRHSQPLQRPAQIPVILHLKHKPLRRRHLSLLNPSIPLHFRHDFCRSPHHLERHRIRRPHSPTLRQRGKDLLPPVQRRQPKHGLGRYPGPIGNFRRQQPRPHHHLVGNLDQTRTPLLFHLHRLSNPNKINSLNPSDSCPMPSVLYPPPCTSGMMRYGPLGGFRPLCRIPTNRSPTRTSISRTGTSTAARWSPPCWPQPWSPSSPQPFPIIPTLQSTR